LTLENIHVITIFIDFEDMNLNTDLYINNYEFRYNEIGDHNNIVVLVHGSASDYRTWDGQLKDFGKYYKTLAYSRRYHKPNKKILPKEDYSMQQHVEDLGKFIRLFGEKPVHLVGHSYGALICLQFAIQNPESVKTLTLAEPPAIRLNVSNSPKPKELLKLLSSKPKLAFEIIKFGSKGIRPATKALKKNDYEGALETFAIAVLGKNTFQNLSKERKTQAGDNFIKSELLGSGFLPLDKEEIKNIKIPALLLWGEKSQKLWHYLLDELDELLPSTEQKMIPKASHIMHEDNPSFFNETVLSFLKIHDN